MRTEGMPSPVVKSNDGESLQDVIAGIEQRHPKLKKNASASVPAPEASTIEKVSREAKIADFIHHKKLQGDY